MDNHRQLYQHQQIQTDSKGDSKRWIRSGYYPVSGLAPAGATVSVNGTAIPSGQIDGQYYLQNVTANNSSAPQWTTANVTSSLGGTVTSNAFVPQTPETSNYDLDGNLLTDGRWNYFWDAENRLIAIETYGNQSGNTKGVWNSGVPLVHINFTYDYLGRRIDKQVYNWNGSAFALSSDTRFVYEHWNLVADYSAVGTFSLAHSYVWGIDLSGRRSGADGVGGLLAMVTASGSIEIPIHDANGNIHGLTDRITSQVTAAYEYSPYGELLRAMGSYAQVNPFQFSSRYTDIETGHINYGHRYYNPALGRFLGRDPTGEKGGLHLYAFTVNQPINRWDIRGMSPAGMTQAQQTYMAQINAFLQTMRELNYSGNGSDSSMYNLGDNGTIEGFNFSQSNAPGIFDGGVNFSDTNGTSAANTGSNVGSGTSVPTGNAGSNLPDFNAATLGPIPNSTLISGPSGTTDAGLSTLGQFGTVVGLGGALYMPGTGVVNVINYSASALSGVGSSATLDFDFNNYAPKGTYGVIQTISNDTFTNTAPGTIDNNGATSPYYDDLIGSVPRQTDQMTMTYNAYSGVMSMQPVLAFLPINADDIVRFEDTPQNPTGPSQYGTEAFQTIIVNRADGLPVATINWGYSFSPNGVTLAPITLTQGGVPVTK